MSEPSTTLAGPGNSQLSLAEAERQLAQLRRVMCDRAAVRTLGRAGYRQALGRLSVMSREQQRQRPGRLRVTSLFVCCLAGPPHPPLALRRALIRRPRRQNSLPAVWQHK